MRRVTGWLEPDERGPLARALAVWAGLSLAVVVATGLYVDRLRSQDEEAAIRHAKADASVAAQTFLRTVDAVRAVLGWTELWQTLSDQGDGPGAAAVEAELGRMVAAGRLGLVQVSVAGDDGRVAWAALPGAIGVSIADREHFLIHTGPSPHPGLFVGAPVIGRTTGRWSIQFSQRLRHGDGTPAGVATVSVDPIALSHALGAADPSASQLVVVRRLSDGALLARSRAPLEHLARQPEPDHPAIVAARAARSGTLRYASRLDGRPVLTAFEVPEGLPVVVQAVRDADDAFAGYARAKLLSILGAAAVVLAGLLVALVWAGRTASLAVLRRSEARLIDSEARFRLLAENSCDVVVLNDLDGNRRYVSPTAQTILGWAPSELLARPVRDSVHPEDLDWVDAALDALRAGEDSASATYRFRRPDGSWQWIEANARTHRGPDGSPAGYVAAIRDVSERKRAERQLLDAYEQMETLASTDPLTGLANRRRFAAALDNEWRRCAREGMPLSLFIADVDHFKRFNDRYGHPAGDVCLQAVAAELNETARRPGDLATRLGGEEFALLMPNTNRWGAWHVAERFRQALRSRALQHQDNAAGVVTVSVGVVTVFPRPDDGKRAPEAALSAADAALYTAKAEGRDRTAEYPMAPAPAPALAPAIAG